MPHLKYFYIALCLLGLSVFSHASFDLDIDDDGNLITVGKNTQEDALEKNDIVSVADIRSELFEGDNIVTDKDTDKGLSKLSEFAKGSDDKSKD